MEQTNKIQRSETWKLIYEIVNKIPREHCDSDAYDAASVTTELEKLFLKLYSTYNIKQNICDNCKCHPTILYATQFGRFCEACLPNIKL